MNDVLRDMLTLAQGEALSGITKVNADVSKIADGICLQFDAVAFEKNITLESRIQENVFADCDEKMIRRLFTILIDNAVKYEPEGGKVFVALQKNGNKTTFAVRNCGSTVKKEDLPHLFERFYRADKSRSGGGVGLGLAIAKTSPIFTAARSKRLLPKQREHCLSPNFKIYKPIFHSAFSALRLPAFRSPLSFPPFTVSCGDDGNYGKI